MSALGKNAKTLAEKETKAKRAEGVAQVVEHLLNKRDALSSNSSTQKGRKEGRKGRKEREKNLTPHSSLFSQKNCFRIQF
jgi:hypothetical protein